MTRCINDISQKEEQPMRRTFAQALAMSGFSVEDEHSTLYTLVYGKEMSSSPCLWDLFDEHFLQMPFRGTCLYAEDFDRRHHFDFDDHPFNRDIDYFASFCEYAYNICAGLLTVRTDTPSFVLLVADHIEKVADAMDHKIVKAGNLYELIENNPTAIEVAVSSSEDTAQTVLGYNHRTMKGDLASKRQALLQLADQIEPKRAILQAANAKLCNQLFFAFNNLHIRHNNKTPGSKSYSPIIAAMSDKQLEEWYDFTYRMCLEAFLVIDRLREQDAFNQLMGSV